MQAWTSLLLELADLAVRLIRHTVPHQICIQDAMCQLETVEVWYLVLCRQGSMIAEPKSEKTLARIAAALETSFVFKGIEQSVLQQVGIVLVVPTSLLLAACDTCTLSKTSLGMKLG